MSDIVTRLDAWENIVTGVGGNRDKSSGFLFAPMLISGDSALLEMLYEEDHISGKIVDAPVDHVFLRGWDTNITDDTDGVLKEKLVDEYDRLEVEMHIDQAMRWERLYGGAAVMVGADDGQSVTMPLKEDRIRKVHFLNSYNRWEMTPYRMYEDPLHQKFGRPELYRLHPQSTTSQVGMLVHESRLVIFNGRPTTKRQQIANQHWGQSVLVRAYGASKQYGGALASVLATMADANQSVYKIKGLFDIIKGKRGEELRARMKAVDEVRSVINAIVLDADGEGFERVATSLTELANLVDRFKLNVCSAAEIPATVLFGQAPAGMNATGQSDMQNWYDRVGRSQRKEAKPRLERITRLIFKAKEGPTGGTEPAKWSTSFPSPWQPTAKENAEIEKSQADRDAIYHDLGILTSAQIARARFSGSEGDGEIVLTPEELEGLEGVTASMKDPATSAGVDTEGVPAGEGQELVETTDNEVAHGEPLGLVTAREHAAKMTEHGLDRCIHGRVNKCEHCGVQRIPDIDIGPDGRATHTFKWATIADLEATQSIETTLDNEDQPRAENGQFGSGGGSSSESGSEERRAAAQEKVSEAREADRSRTEQARSELADAKERRAAKAQELKQAEKELRKEVGPERERALQDVEQSERNAEKLEERIAAAEAGERAHSPEALRVAQDVPAAKEQLAAMQAENASTREALGEETPEQREARGRVETFYNEHADLDAEVESLEAVTKGAARRDRAFGNLESAVKSGDAGKIDRAQEKLTTLLAASDEQVFDDATFAAIDADEHRLSGDIFDGED